MGELYLRKVVVDIIPTVGAGKTIDGLRIRFKCEKTSESNPNKAEIEIFNLSDNTRSLLERQDTRIRLAFGYTGRDPGGEKGASTSSVETIFIGNIKKVAHEPDPPNIITKIELADGGNRYRTAYLDKGYPPNVRFNQVVGDLSTALGLGSPVLVDTPSTIFANGVAFSGLVKDHLDVMTRGHNLEWSIQDEVLQIIPKNKPTAENAVLLSPESGLVKFPTKTKEGVEFECLINPKLKPGRLVKIESRFIKGGFKVRKVVHEGDSHEGDFLSKCIAK